MRRGPTPACAVPLGRREGLPCSDWVRRQGGSARCCCCCAAQLAAHDFLAPAAQARAWPLVAAALQAAAPKLGGWRRRRRCATPRSVFGSFGSKASWHAWAPDRRYMEQGKRYEELPPRFKLTTSEEEWRKK